MPTGIIISNGHTWKQQRHIGIISLRKLGLGKKSIEHRIEEVAQTLVEVFRQTKVQREVDQGAEGPRLTGHPLPALLDVWQAEKELREPQLPQDRKKLPYTNAVIHEMQRVKYVFVAGAPRQSTKDVKMRGYHIPKGTMILPDLRSVLLDPEQWETPEEFNPNHFLDKDGKFIKREEFLPFGIGNCGPEDICLLVLWLYLSLEPCGLMGFGFVKIISVSL
ncbi:cytochrome P450 2J5-like [Crotalus adamanteus]|uniref:Cytochrome P450 2J5-like n=1 Tax=Crotalus adamanteus TaxID=8729 RepID=A0AAW1BHK7_CROAD